LPTDNEHKPKRPKATITLSAVTKKNVAVDATDNSTVDRKFTTRAKDAARRGGRTLFAPAQPKDDANAEAIQQPRVADKKHERSDRVGDDAARRRRPTSGTSFGSSTGTSAVATEKRFSEPRRGGKMRDQKPPQSERPAMPPTVPREPDGMVRVSKLLSEQGLCSRREADSYIARGWVWVDGVRITELGTRVPTTAVLKLDREAEAMQEQRMTILLNKPIGYVSGQAEDGYQPASVLATSEHQIDGDEVAFQPAHRRGLAPAGRLDIDSTGLLVLTQDGRIAKHLIGENSEVDKEYLVRVEGTLNDEGLRLLNHGLLLEGEALKPAIVRWQNEDQLNFILREGKKRQIRRMCEMVGLKVVGLKRIRIGRVKLGDLPVGKWRFLRSDESF
jgi:23S rRNA pseudouridine2604 synthase